MSNIKGFIFYFLARSGSTYTIMKLKNHPNIIARAEVFGAKELPGGLEQTSDNQIKFLRKFFRDFKKSDRRPVDKARGFKIQLDKNAPQIQQPGRFAKVIQDYDLCHFYLYRRNKVKQLVSSYRAKQVRDFTKKTTGLAQAHMYKENDALKNKEFEKIYIPPMEFKKRLFDLKKKDAYLNLMKEKTGCTRELFYEDMMADKNAFFKVICEDIGVDPALLEPEDEVLKITSDDLTEVIGNFNELREVLKGTEFEAQLLEGAA